MKIAICDDNPSYAKLLWDAIYTCCAKRNWLLNGSCFTSPQQLLHADLSGTQALFLDIDMPELNGIEAARQLREKYAELIIVFVTGYLEYAPEGYCVNALRYLLKSRIDQELDSCLNAIQERLLENSETIFIQQNDCMEEIAVKDIILFEGTPTRHVLLRTKFQGDGIKCLGKLEDYETRLKEKGFLRLQKSYLVNMSYIDKLSGYRAKLRNGMEIRVSRQNYAQIRTRYVMWKGQRL